MTARAWSAVALCGIIAAIGAAGCDRTETATSAVTTSSPAGSSTAPSAASAAARDHALVRVVHAVPASTTFDLFAGDLLLFDAVGFKAVSPYRAVDGRRYAFALRPAGMTQARPLSVNTEDLNDGSFYTLIVMPGDGPGPRLRVVDDHLDAPANGKTRLRIVHAGNAGSIDVRAAGGSAALFDGVEHHTVSGYTDVLPMNGTVEIAAAGQPSPLATTVAHLEAGRFYTLVIVSTASEPAKLEAFLIEDALRP
jgi:hypothetical protein